MARMRRAWYYQRQAREAQQREDFLENYQGPPEGTTIQSRGPSTAVFYRSLALRSGTDHLFFSTSVDNDSLAIVSATNAGLVTTLPANTTALPLRGSGIKPSRASWYRGDPNPTYVRSRWGTSYARNYQPGTHRSVPLSRATGAFDAADLVEAFNGLFGPGGTLRGNLGTNGRANLELERVPVSAST